MLTIAQLRETVSRSAIVELSLDVLSGLGFQATSWADGSIQKTILSTVATLIADASEIAKTLAEYSWNDYASGVALTELSKSHYNNTRLAGVKTVGTLTLSSTAAIPYTITVGQLIAATPSGIKYANTTGGTLNAGGTLAITWQAVKEGIAGNNAAPSTLVTPLAGVTIQEPSVTPWYSTSGADEESDEKLRIRNRTKWGLFSIELVRDGYLNLALNQPGITKVWVEDTNPRGPGTIDVYVAGDLQLTSDTERDALQTDFKSRVLGVNLDTPEDGSVQVHHASTTPLVPIGTVYHDPAFDASTMAQRIESALTLLLSGVPLGGYTYGPDFQNKLSRSDVFAALEAVDGVASVIIELESDIEIGPATLLTLGSLGGLEYKAVV